MLRIDGTLMLMGDFSTTSSGLPGRSIGFWARTSPRNRWREEKEDLEEELGHYEGVDWPALPCTPQLCDTWNIVIQTHDHGRVWIGKRYKAGLWTILTTCAKESKEMPFCVIVVLDFGSWWLINCPTLSIQCVANYVWLLIYIPKLRPGLQPVGKLGQNL